MSLTINGTQIPVQGIRALKPGITIEQASQKVKNNGLDEIFFTTEGKSYVAYGDSLNIKSLKKNSIPSVMFDGKKADVIVWDDEANSVLEGASKGAMDALKDTGNAVIGAVKNIITTVGPGSALAAGAGVAGYTIYQMVKNGQGIGASMALATAPGTGKTILDLLQGATVGAVKLIAVTAAVGAGVTAGYGAIKGAIEAKNKVNDYTSIASITEDGASPVNGGPATNAYGNYQPTPGYGYQPQPAPTYPQQPGYSQPYPNPGFGQFNTVGNLMSPAQMRAYQR